MSRWLDQMVTHPRFELAALKVQRKRNLPWRANLLKILIRNLISEKGLTAGNKIMNRCIDFRSTAGNSHAPSHDNASKQKLLASTLNLPWLWAAASKFKSGVVLSEIWLTQIEDSNRFPMGIYLPSSDQCFRFYDVLHDDGFAENYNSG
jgi:hypothetical protein